VRASYHTNCNLQQHTSNEIHIPHEQRRESCSRINEIPCTISSRTHLSPKIKKYLVKSRTFPAPPKYIFLPFKFPRINPTGLQPCSAPISFPYSLRERDHHYHCCCCCWIPCLCLRVLMVRFGCGQPWCMTLYAAPAAPTARLLAAGLL